MQKLFSTLKFAIFLAIIFSIRKTVSVRILVVIPHRSFSHAKTFEPYFLKLAELGHRVTVVSYFSSNQKSENYRDISIKKSNDSGLSFFPIKHSVNNVIVDLNLMVKVGKLFENVLKSEAVQELFNSDEKFDLFITEAFMSRLCSPIAEKYRIPSVYLSSNIMFPNNAVNLGDYVNPAFVVSPLGGCSWKMDFLQRVFHLGNVVMNVMWFEAADKWSTQPVAEKYFDLNGKSLKEIESEGSIVLVNSHFTVSGSRPVPPNIIDVGGINLLPANPIPLSKILVNMIYYM